MQQLITRLLKQQPWLFDLTKRATRILGRRNSIYKAVAAQACCRQKLTFVQIGANDGISNDPIREFVVRFGWTGVVVEPIPQLFEKLKGNYRRHPNVHPFQGAVSYCGAANMTLFRVKDSALGLYPDWANQIASFDKTHILKHFSGVTEKEIEAVCVPAFTVEDLVKRFSLRTCDFLAIDVEGFEASIIPRLQLQLLKTKFVLFETLHLQPQEIETINRYLTGHAFQCFELGRDVLAVRQA